MKICQFLFSQCKHQKAQANQEEYPDGHNGIAHRAGALFNQSVNEQPAYSGKFFHHVVEAEKGGVISGLREHFRIGGTGQGLGAAHDESDEKGRRDEAGSIGDEVCADTDKDPDSDGQDKGLEIANSA